MKINYQGEPIVGEPLKKVLDQLISTKLSELGLKWRGDYYWIGESIDGIRRIVHYSLITRGGYRGVLTWGVALDVMVLPSGSKLIYNRTEKSAKLHLFEWPQGYIDSSSGKQIVDGTGVTSHSSQVIYETISKVINDELPNIKNFFQKASSLEGLFKIAQEQMEFNTTLGQMHYPPPSYILAFLYAKTGHKDKAIEMIERTKLINNDETTITIEDIKDKILSL